MFKLFVAQREFGSRLDADDNRTIFNDIERTNWLRLRLFFILTMIYEVLLILGVDLPSLATARSGLSLPGPGAPIGAGEAPALPLAFMVCHGGIFLCSGLGLLTAVRILANKEAPKKPGRGLLSKPTVLPGLFTAVILMFLGVIAGLDQLRGGDINAFIFNIIVAAVLLYLRPPLGFLVFTPGFVLMIAGVLTFQRDAGLRLAHLVNGSIFYSAVLLISAYLFNNQFSQLAKSLLLEKAAATIKDLSLHDELTGLFNRRAFAVIVEQELARMQREKQRGVLAIADIDLFKGLNDTHGHPVGDAALRAVAKTLKEATRSTDAVARWGGEEFILLIEGCDEEAALTILERARSMVQACCIETEYSTIRCTISIGYTEIDAGEDDPFDKAYHRADAALYQAKESGRNRVVGSGKE